MSQDSNGPVSEHPDPDETVDTNAGDDAVMGTVADNGPEDAGEPMDPNESSGQSGAQSDQKDGQ